MQSSTKRYWLCRYTTVKIWSASTADLFNPRGR